jgi:hypothetical protein
LWGTTAWKNFFYPMNIGFRRGVMKVVNDGNLLAGKN